ncbi:hypothetical protein CARUB_v10028373mg [Capsella rubella]|uniref:RING-type domain-containing protein n=1 Tax=Capsella rubella TaxID=81985 RepID=R0F195_9BRAS|nr:uncharacterized protein LOC17876849 [Capsella rubella]EOA15016.1 hypothetical protein CARUB_v10028373mg [Capsella rubella]
MDSKERVDDEKTLDKSGEMISKLQERVDKIISDLQTPGSSAATLTDVQTLYNEIKQLLNTTTKTHQDPAKVSPHIRDELDTDFVAEEVGHSCDLCQRDLAKDPERPNASLRSLQESCVLSCGHVYHFKCLKGTTLDIDNHSNDPSCVFCISCSS